MTRFSKRATVVRKVVNKAGGVAYVESPELEVAGILLTSFAGDQYYRTANETFDRLNTLVGLVPEFAAKAAVYARNEFGMRSITHALAGEVAAQVKGEEWTSKFFNTVVRRPDDITEILSYYLSKYGKPLPNALKRGLGEAFGKFDEYQLAKYRGEGNAVSLVDAVNLLHPKPVRGKNLKALRALVKGKLKSTETWENKLSAAGLAAEPTEKAEAKAQAWGELLREGKLGYFALLRNLRNIAEQAPDCIPMACSQLVDRDAIKKSLVLPFRFATAAEQVVNHPQVLRAISQALEISLDNVPEFGGITLVVLDTSGSMQSAVSPHNRRTVAELGALFTAVIAKRNRADMMFFADNANYVTYNPNDSVLGIVSGMRFKSGGTNFHSIFNTAHCAYDRIIILSDMQGWIANSWDAVGGAPIQSFKNYKARTGANPHVYSFNLADQGGMMFPEKQVYAIAGFSEKVFDIFKMLEEDKNALINRIKGVKFV